MVSPEWVAALKGWAEGEPLIDALYLFGSRIKGKASPNSSRCGARVAQAFHVWNVDPPV
jgi:hypothetical protein